MHPIPPIKKTTEVAVVMLLSQCNMRCSFCINDDAMKAAPEEDLQALLEALRQSGVLNLVLGGGEPLMWPHDLYALAHRAKSLGFLVQLGTNGLLLKEGFEQSPHIDRFVLPLDAMTASVHNNMRVWQGSHLEKIQHLLHQLQRVQKSTTVSTVLTQENIGELEQIASFLKNLNTEKPFLHAWHLYKFVPEGRGGATNAARLLLSHEDYIRVARPLQDRNLGFKVYLRPDMLHSKSVQFFWFQNERFQTL